METATVGGGLMKPNEVYYNEKADRIKIVEVDPDLMSDWALVESEIGNRFHIRVTEINNQYTKLEK